MSITRTGEDTFLRGILENLETGLVVVDGSGTIVFSNDAAGELVGRSPQRLSDRVIVRSGEVRASRPRGLSTQHSRGGSFPR